MLALAYFIAQRISVKIPRVIKYQGAGEKLWGTLI